VYGREKKVMATTLDATPFTATIVESIDISGAVRYVVEVVQQPRKWLLWRRYSDFLALHTTLQTQPTAQPLPRMPPKCYWPLGPDAPFLEERLHSLQLYLTALSSRPDLRALAAVQAFVAPPPSSDPPSQQEPPQYFPDPPAQGVSTAPGSLAARVLTDGAAALRALFVFRQSLTVDTAPAKQAAVYDTQRVRVATAVTTLRSLLPELDAAAATAPFFAECATVVRAVEQWAAGIDDSEAATLRAALGNSTLQLWPLRWYEAQVASVLANFADAAAAAMSAPPLPGPHPDEERATRLLGQMRDEMEHRSRAGQVASVTRLRALCGQIEGHRGRNTASYLRSTLATPQTVLAALQKRGRDLATTVAAVCAGHASTEGVAQEELLKRIEQLGSDVVSCRNELQAARQGSAATEAALDQLQQLVADLRHQLHGPVSVSSTTEAPAVEAPNITDDVFKL